MKLSKDEILEGLRRLSVTVMTNDGVNISQVCFMNRCDFSLKELENIYLLVKFLEIELEKENG